MRTRAVRSAAHPVAALALGLALALGQVQSGLAHAHVTTASPAAEAVLASSPSSLTLGFDSQLAASGNQIVLYHSDRSAVGTYTPPAQNGKSPTLQAKLPTLAPDIYTVAWTSVSGEDGHTLQQFYAFTVGNVPEASPPAALPPLKVGDTQVMLTASRGNVGPLVVHAAVRDATGKPLTNLQRVILRYQPAGLTVGQDEIVAPATGSDAQTPAFTLGLAGSWQFDVIVRRSGLDDVDTTTQLTLAPATIVGAAPPATATAAPTAAPTAATPTETVAAPATATVSTAATTAPTPTTVAVATVVPSPSAAATATVPPAITAQATSTAPPTIAPTVASTPTATAKLPESSNSTILIGGIAALAIVGGIVAFAVRRASR